MIYPTSYFVSPASPTKAEIIEAIHHHFLNPRFSKNSTEQAYDVAGTIEERVEDLYEAFESDAELIFAMRGGYGCNQLLPAIDFDRIDSTKKFFGYSDLTAFSLALWKYKKVVTYSGFMPVDFLQGIGPRKRRFLDAIIDGEELPKIDDFKTLVSGEVKGIVLGGCLSIVVSLLGTKWLPDFTNKILLLEEIGEPTYKIDRMLWSLQEAGIFDQCSGIILGQFTNCVPRNEHEMPLINVFNRYFTNIEKPVIYDFPYGHFTDSTIIPIGSIASITKSFVQFQ